MQDRQAINDSYYCGRFRQDSIVSVLTGNSYVVAEYDERTGDIRWQRVVNASQKEGIHNWLKEHFPVQAASVQASMKVPVKAAAKAVPQPKGKVAPNKPKAAPTGKAAAGRKRALASV